MIIAEVSIVPLGTKTPSVSRYVKKALSVLKKEKVKFSPTAMGTIIEGKSLNKVLKAVAQMHQTVLKEKGIRRVVTSLKIDERTDKSLTIEGKLKAIK